MAGSLTELRRRMLHLGTVAGQDAAFEQYRDECLGADRPVGTDPNGSRASHALVQQGFEAGWTRALQAVDRLMEEVHRDPVASKEE